MQNRIDQCFSALRARNEKAFIAYICAGDPDLSRTVDLALALEKAGADIGFEKALLDWIVKHRSNWREKRMKEARTEKAAS